MSALHVYVIRCDGTFDKDDKSGGPRVRCAETFESREEKASTARKLAAATGWTAQRGPTGNGFFYVHDFCPTCSKERAAERAADLEEIASEGSP